MTSSRYLILAVLLASTFVSAQQITAEGRNVVQGPGFTNWDFSTFKDIHLTEHNELQLRGEFFNLLNHANLRLPESNIASPNFGKIDKDTGGDPAGTEAPFLGR
jgi:hypothetical protein